MAVTGNVGMGLILAALLDKSLPTSVLYLLRLAYFLPVLTSTALVSLVWQFIYSTDLGVLNYYLLAVGLPKVGWLTDRNVAMTSVVIMDVWKHFGFFMVILLAALQSIPRSAGGSGLARRGQSDAGLPACQGADDRSRDPVLRDLCDDHRPADVRDRQDPDLGRAGRRDDQPCHVHVRADLLGTGHRSRHVGRSRSSHRHHDRDLHSNPGGRGRCPTDVPFPNLSPDLPPGPGRHLHDPEADRCRRCGPLAKPAPDDRAAGRAGS